jgi:PAS domain S-box-containing protein
MRLLIVDDHEVVRRGVRSLLADHNGWNVCGEAVDGQDALEKARDLKPDLIVMDVSMPRLNGLEATRQIRSILPDAEVLVLSQHENSEMARQALKAGARGYVVKSSISKDLLSAVTKVSRREYFFDPAILDQSSSTHTDVQEILHRSAAFEKALRESEERSRKLADYQAAVMNNMAEGLYAVDENGLLISINPAGEAILGWTKEELLGKKMHDVAHYKHPDGRPFPANECSGLQVLQNGVALREHEDTFIRRDGTFVPVVFSASPLKENGKITGVIVSFRDDTAQRRAREALHDSREQLVLALQSSKSAMFDWDVIQRRGNWNPQMTDIYGFQPESEYINAEEWMALFHPDDVERLREEAERFWKEGDEFYFEFRTAPQDGGVKWISSHGRIVRDASGRAIRMIGTHTDITERKEIETAIATGARQQRAMFNLADELHRAESLDEVHSAALNAILNALQCNRASILLCDSDRVMRFQSWRGLSNEYRAAVEGHSAWKKDDPNPQPFSINDVNKAELTDALKAAIRKEGINALSFIPLVSHGKLVGKFMAYFNERHAFSNDEIEVSLTIGRQLAFAIDRLRNDIALRESKAQLAQEREALAKLNASSSRLWRMGTLEGGLTEMLSATIELLGSDKGNVQLLDPERQVLTIAAQSGFEKDFLNFFREVSANDDTACGRALRTGERMVIADVEQDVPYAPFREVARAAGYRAVISAPLIGNNGAPIGILSTHFSSPHCPSEPELRRLDLYVRQAADFIERCRSEESLRKSNEAAGLLATIVTSSDDAIVSKNLNGIIQSWNAGAERIFGYTAKEAIGQPITLIIPPDRRAEEDDIITRLGRGERIDHFQTVRRRKDGAMLDVSVTISPLRDSSGRVIGASKVARDITNQKRAEETLGLMKLQDAEQRRIARELHDSAGQTLTVLGMSLAQLVHKTEGIAPELAKEGKAIEEVVRQLHREIRTTSYLLHPPLLDEAGLPSALNWYVQGVAERSGLAIDLQISDNLGRLPADMELAFFRVVQECLTNIHRHAESKTARIRLARENGSVCIEVQDDGKGMSPQRLAEIQARGSGVGIGGIRERLRQFSGTLRIESDQNGTRVFASVPVPKGTQPEFEPLQAAV